MNKNTEATMDWIDNAIYDGAMTISWYDIIEGGVELLQSYIDDGSLVASGTEHVYVVGIEAWLKRTESLDSLALAISRV